MYLSNAILGKSVVDQLLARQEAPVLKIGNDIFTREHLAKIKCWNFLAASRLSHLLTAELKVKDTADLFNNVPPQHLAVPGLGAICLATIGAAFELKKLGNLRDYIAKHTEKGHSIVTFYTMKTNIHDQQAARAEKREIKNRKAARQRAAHELRVERHVERTNGTTTN